MLLLASSFGNELRRKAIKTGSRHRRNEVPAGSANPSQIPRFRAFARMESPEVSRHLFTIGIMTSGGDSQGMNAAIRAAVRWSILMKYRVYLIKNGWSGVVRGGDSFIPCTWHTVSGILEMGGTVIGTARCAEFREKKGRKIATLHLIEKEINALMVIGGDGSLTGASILSAEWQEHQEALLNDGLISGGLSSKLTSLKVVGLVGSIDNDLCGTDFTIGANSALHRILDACDCLVTTASSHGRAFVVQCMGRDAGYLTLYAGVLVGADFIFIPENPPDEAEDWLGRMCQAVKFSRQNGKTSSIVMLAEGARTVQGTLITPQDVAAALEERMSLDVRTTVLGHIQRGGKPTARDRIVSTLTAVEGVEALSTMREHLIIGFAQGGVVRLPLTPTIQTTQSVGHALRQQLWLQVRSLRGPQFEAIWNVWDQLFGDSCIRQGLGRGEDVRQLAGEHTNTPTSLTASTVEAFPSTGRVLMVLCVGPPSPGMNMTLRMLVRTAAAQGFVRVLGVEGGIPGLLSDRIVPLYWSSVMDWSVRGGCKLGTRRLDSDVPIPVEGMIAKFRQYRIASLILLGGYDCLAVGRALHEALPNHGLSLSTCIIPATISCNMPGTDATIGADTALNEIVQAVDKVRMSAQSSMRRVFVVQVMGGSCGWLTMYGSLCCGSDIMYLPEEGIDIDRLKGDVDLLRRRFHESKKRSVILMCSDNPDTLYDHEFIYRLLKQEGKSLEFDVRSVQLGHVQQGSDPSAEDRLLAVLFAQEATRKLQQLATGSGGTYFVGLRGSDVVSIPLAEVDSLADPQHRRPRHPKWQQLVSIVRRLSNEPQTLRTFTSW
jgi:6-phosphofructokinase 1